MTTFLSRIRAVKSGLRLPLSRSVIVAGLVARRRNPCAPYANTTYAHHHPGCPEHHALKTATSMKRGILTHNGWGDGEGYVEP